MKIQVLSDIHINHWDQPYEEFLDSIQTDARLLVLAGDAFDLEPEALKETEERLEVLCRRYKSVVYVPGNHEFYHTTIMDGLRALMAIEQRLVAKGYDLWVAHPGMTQTYSGIRVIGGTMWQPKPDRRYPPITDHFLIGDFSQEAPLQFQTFYDYLKGELREDDVVVTHHTPSYRSCSKKFEGSEINRWFHTPEVEPLILERKPRLFIHGHTHDPFDYQLGDTRVICNPRGYPGEHVSFNPRLVIDL